MIDFLKRQKLQRQGYSCGKKRREQNESEWRELLRSSPYVRWLIVAAFICVLGFIVPYVGDNAGYQHMGEGMGIAAMLVLVPVSLAHLKLNLRQLWDRNSRMLLLFGLVLLQLGLLMGVWWVAGINNLKEDFILFLAPVALAPILATLLCGKRAGFFAVIYSSLWGMLLSDWRVAFHFGIVSAVAGIVSIWAVRRLRKRSQLLNAGLLSGLAAAFICGVVGRLEKAWFQGMEMEAWRLLGTEAGAVVLTGIFTAVLAGGLLPVLEAVFRITTTISWIELADLNHPLLRRMTLEAPGTYHHSLMVANLAEAAAESVGANPTICRVCSYFHDIGKLSKPEYCIENITDEENPHNDLKPAMSALIVMAHVKEGVDLAVRHKLNREILDVIQQHHGTSLVYYFYRRAIDQQEAVKKLAAEGKADASEVPEVKESAFRYQGPLPSTRESAIISLADAVESASRSLQKPTPQKIESLIDDIILSRLKDYQLDDCDLRMFELTLIKESFAKTLRTALHRRIPYPEEKETIRKEREEGHPRQNKPVVSPQVIAPQPSPAPVAMDSAAVPPSPP